MDDGTPYLVWICSFNLQNLIWRSFRSSNNIAFRAMDERLEFYLKHAMPVDAKI
jgi:hypothetical protein